MNRECIFGLRPIPERASERDIVSSDAEALKGALRCVHDVAELEAAFRVSGRGETDPPSHISPGDPNLQWCRFVEVKSQRDKLDPRQKAWLRLLWRCRARAEVAHVREPKANRTSTDEKKEKAQ